jgi:uncharacterized protein (DUF2141 family)
MIRIGVFRSSEGYPDKPAHSYSVSKEKLDGGRIIVQISARETGIYGISILDDENENGKMDYRFGIMPKEGFGFSNNPRIKGLKEPPFNETSFTYSGGKKTVTVSMIYI